MAENSAISWTDHTFNPWTGCTKVSSACDFCYAEKWAQRSGRGDLWKGKRARTTVSYWKQPHKWNGIAARAGKRAKVFCASLADVFDNQVPDEWRADLWELIASTRNLDWLLLTKRPQNIAKMLPVMDSTQPFYKPWNEKWPWNNVWLGTTVENQEEANRRIPALLSVPARVHFLSCEPLLGPLKLRPLNVRNYKYGEDEPASLYALDGRYQIPGSHWSETHPRIDWVIAGGESGPGRREMDMVWVDDLRLQCQGASVPFFFKQDAAARPGQRGRAGDQLWASKQFPEVRA